MVAAKVSEHPVFRPELEGHRLPPDGLAKDLGRLVELIQVAQHFAPPLEAPAQVAGVIGVGGEVVGQSRSDGGCLAEQLLGRGRVAGLGEQDAEIVERPASDQAKRRTVGQARGVRGQPILRGQRGAIPAFGLCRLAGTDHLKAEIVIRHCQLLAVLDAPRFVGEFLPLGQRASRVVQRLRKTAGVVQRVRAASPLRGAKSAIHRVSRSFSKEPFHELRLSLKMLQGGRGVPEPVKGTGQSAVSPRRSPAVGRRIRHELHQPLGQAQDRDQMVAFGRTVARLPGLIRQPAAPLRIRQNLAHANDPVEVRDRRGYRAALGRGG